MKNYTINSREKYKMDKEELKTLIKQGLKNGLVVISDNLFDYGLVDIGCKIGDNAFYFCHRNRECHEHLLNTKGYTRKMFSKDWKFEW